MQCSIISLAGGASQGQWTNLPVASINIEATENKALDVPQVGHARAIEAGERHGNSLGAASGTSNSRITIDQSRSVPRFDINRESPIGLRWCQGKCESSTMSTNGIFWLLGREVCVPVAPCSAWCNLENLAGCRETTTGSVVRSVASYIVCVGCSDGRVIIDNKRRAGSSSESAIKESKDWNLHYETIKTILKSKSRSSRNGMERRKLKEKHSAIYILWYLRNQPRTARYEGLCPSGKPQEQYEIPLCLKVEISAPILFFSRCNPKAGFSLGPHDPYTRNPEYLVRKKEYIVWPISSPRSSPIFSPPSRSPS